MSSNACVVYFGIRYDVKPDEIEALEARSDERVQKARKAGLSSYWANFGPGDRHVLLIGSKLGVLGPEDRLSLTLDANNVVDLVSATNKKLEAAGFEPRGALHCEWLSDN